MSFFLPLLPLLPCQIFSSAERDVNCSCVFLVIRYPFPTLGRTLPQGIGFAERFEGRRGGFEGSGDSGKPAGRRVSVFGGGFRGDIDFREVELLCDGVKAHLGRIVFALHGIAGDMHGRKTGICKYVRINLGFVFPCVQNIRMPAAEQGLLVHYATSGGIDDKCAGFALAQECFVAEVVGGSVKRDVEGDDVAISFDFIERNAYSFGWIIEEHMHASPLCHLHHQRADMTDTDDTNGDW